MKKVLFIIAFILLSSKANAETILVCNSCDSQIQALNFASEQLSHRGKFNGLISVGNVQEGKNYAFNVFYTGGGEDRFGNEIPITLEVQQAPVPYSTIQLFQSIGQTKLYLDAYASITVPEGAGFSSAWEVSSSSSRQGEFEQWYHDEHSASYYIRASLSAFGGIFNGALSGLVIRFEFPDKSIMELKAPELADADFKFKYIPNSAKDKDNNQIPDYGQEPSGSYKFSSVESMQDFILRAAEYGHEIWFSNSAGLTCGVNVDCRVVVTEN